jgi:hypothetical protein
MSSFDHAQTANYKDKLVEMLSSADIPVRWRATPIEQFIQAQNLGYPLHPHNTPQVLISTCMEFRYALPVPANYAFVIRTPGGRLLGSEFAIGYVLHRGVSCILLIAHNDCAMAHLPEHELGISDAFVAQGWSKERADQFVKEEVAKRAVKDELEVLEKEYHRLKELFKKVRIAPLFLTLHDKRVHLPRWYHELNNRERA